MARGYRAILELEGAESAMQTADRLFHEWVNKKYPPGGSRAGVECDAEGIYRFGELTSKRDETADVVATKLSEASEDKHYERQLLEMVERRENGDQWTTRVYALHATKESNYDQVLWIEVTPPREGEWDAKPPALVRDLITEGHCHDRGMPLSDSPQSVADEDQVEQLIGWIRDERRRASVVVAAPLTDGSDSDALEAEYRWKDILRSLTKDSLGCASYFLLTPEAYRQFHARIGQGCAMPKGSLRTYLPGFRSDEPTDRLRHRVLTAGTLLRGYDEKSKRFRPELSAIIARTPCEYLWENGLDKELRRAQALLDKKRLTVPTFHPLRESERTVELLDEKVRQRVAESFSVAASDAGGTGRGRARACPRGARGSPSSDQRPRGGRQACDVRTCPAARPVPALGMVRAAAPPDSPLPARVQSALAYRAGERCRRAGERPGRHERRARTACAQARRARG